MKIVRTKDYSRNAERVGEFTPCARCGRAIKDIATATFVELTIDWEIIPAGDPRSNTRESQGGWPIGPECRKILNLNHQEG